MAQLVHRGLGTQSASGFVSPDVERRAIERLRSDMETGEWDRCHGHPAGGPDSRWLASRRGRCWTTGVDGDDDGPRVASASRLVAADAPRIFELIADPAEQPRWDGNDNLAEADRGQRVRAVGEIFIMTLTGGNVRENHVVAFDEGRRIAWRPAEPGQEPPGHLWRWELEPTDSSHTLVTHTYDWTELTDKERLPRARATTAEKLEASLDRLAALAEGQPYP
jgi:uncharacterized protein YndB with AHSA1/START domain